MLKKKFNISLTLLIAGLFFVNLFIFPKTAKAVFTESYIRLDRVKANTATTATVCAKPATTAIENDVQVVFPGNGTLGAASFGVSSTALNWTVTTSNLPSGAVAWLGIGTASTVSGATVTFPSSDLTVGTMYCFNIAGGTTITTPTSAGNSLTGTITTRTSVPATIDQTTYAVSIISNDQVVISASVAQNFTLTLSGNTIALGALLTSGVTSGSVTVTVATNALTGWVMWVNDTNAGLKSTQFNTTLATLGTIDDATSTVGAGGGVVLDSIITTDSANGTGVVSQGAGYGAEYAGGTTCSTSTTGGTLSTILQPVARANGTTDGDVITLCYIARATAYTPAASDYADTLTVTAAGRF